MLHGLKSTDQNGMETTSLNNTAFVTILIRIRPVLHILASVIFLLVAFVHADAIDKDIKLLHYYNTLFPFLSNRTLFYISILIEVVSGLVCIMFCSRNFADYWIISFIVLMLWYRLGMHLTNPNGYTCGCLGILTVIFRWTKFQESAAAYGTLATLFLCASPGLFLRFREFLTLRYLKLASIWVLVFSAFTMRADTIELYGHYDRIKYDPLTGAPFVTPSGVPDEKHFTFTAILAGTTWSISVTNLDDSNLWTDLIYDGTNTYFFNPCTPPFVPTNQIVQNAEYVTISPSPYFLPALSDWAFSYMPWVTYGLNPSEVHTNNSGFLEIPLPWQTPRLKERAYGWNWLIQPSEDGRFVASCRVEREPKLDFASDSKELLRVEMDYPESILDKNWYLSQLAYRKQFPNHFLDTQYTCTAWLTTNGMTIPMNSEMSQFQYIPRKTSKSPLTRLFLVVDAVQVNKGDRTVLDELMSTRLMSTRIVKDYRYKKSNGSRIYKRAEYVLAPRQDWKSDADPILLQQVAYYLKHGPRYDWYDYKSKQILTWVLGVCIVLPPILLLIYKQQKLKKKGDYEKT